MKLIKRAVTNVDDDDGLDREVDVESVDSGSEPCGLKAELKGRLRVLRNLRRSNKDNVDRDLKNLLAEEDNDSDTGSGQESGEVASEPADEENQPDFQVVRLESVPYVRVVVTQMGARRLPGPNLVMRFRPAGARVLPAESLPRPKERQVPASRLRIKMRLRLNLLGAMKARDSCLEVPSRKK